MIRNIKCVHLAFSPHHRKSINTHYFSTIFCTSYKCHHPKSAQCADFGDEKQGGRNHISHTCLIVFFLFFLNFDNISSNLYILCTQFLLILSIHSKLYPISTKNWCSWSCNIVTYKINVLSRMFEFPVSISRDRWWGSTLLSKWHSDVLLSTSDWPPFYQPSTLADASWYVNVILEHCWNFNLSTSSSSDSSSSEEQRIRKNIVASSCSWSSHLYMELCLGLLPFCSCLRCCNYAIY